MSRLWGTRRALQCFRAHTEILELVLVVSEYQPRLCKEIMLMLKQKLIYSPFPITNIFFSWVFLIGLAAASI